MNTGIDIALAQPYVTPGRSLGINKAPTGLQYVGASAQAKGYKVNLLHDDNTRIKEELLALRPDHVGISCMTNNFPESVELAEFVRWYMPKVRSITLGGWHAMGCAASYRQFKNSGGNLGETETLEEMLYPPSPFNFIVDGEGEFAYVRLLEALNKNASKEELARISGLGFLDGNRIIVLNSPEAINIL